MEEEKKMKKLEAAKKKQEQEVSLMVYIDSDLLRLCHQGNLHVSVTVADGETGQDEDPCKRNVSQWNRQILKIRWNGKSLFYLPCLIFHEKNLLSWCHVGGEARGPWWPQESVAEGLKPGISRKAKTKISTRYSRSWGGHGANDPTPRNHEVTAIKVGIWCSQLDVCLRSMTWCGSKSRKDLAHGDLLVQTWMSLFEMTSASSVTVCPSELEENSER